MNYHLVKLSATNTLITLSFPTHSALLAHLRTMILHDPGASIVAIYIGP